MVKAEPIGKSPWPRAIVGVFILLAAWNGVVLYYALSTRVPTIDEQPYENGLKFEETILQRDAARRDGVSVEFDRAHDKLHVTAAGLPKGDWHARLRMIRPDDITQDRRMEAQFDGQTFTFSSFSPRSGLWLMQLHISDSERRYYFEQRQIF